MDEIILPDGTARKLGNIVPPADYFRVWPVFGDQPAAPVLPRSQWQETDLSAFLPPTHDQDGVGQCNPEAATALVESLRAMAGLPPVQLSPADLYDRVNDGVDRGSMLEDAMAELLANGVGTAATVPVLWRRGMRPAPADERRRFRVTELWLAPTFDHYASGLQAGFFGVHGVMWYPNFTPDGDGWLPARGQGRPGGHAVLGYGLAHRNGVWGVRTRNSWGTGWGKDGNCVMPESLFGRDIGGWWLGRVVVQEPGDLPAPRP